MRAGLRRWLPFALALLLSCAAAPAAERMRGIAVTEERIALVIGKAA